MFLIVLREGALTSEAALRGVPLKCSAQAQWQGVSWDSEEGGKCHCHALKYFLHPAVCMGIAFLRVPRYFLGEQKPHSTFTGPSPSPRPVMNDLTNSGCEPRVTPQSPNGRRRASMGKAPGSPACSYFSCNLFLRETSRNSSWSLLKKEASHSRVNHQY